MTKLFCFSLFFMACAHGFSQKIDSTRSLPKEIVLFNGKNLDGWEGDKHIWRVHKGAIVGGNKKNQVLQNEFLATTLSYTNYILEVKFKIKGYKGFINAGVQFHSDRLANPSNEMAGYQADIGGDCMGSLYDESRRDTYLAKADQHKVSLKKGWNDYKISSRGNKITLWINNKETLTYEEPDASIPQDGKIGLQIHGGGTLEVYYKDIVLTPFN